MGRPVLALMAPDSPGEPSIRQATHCVVSQPDLPRSADSISLCDSFVPDVNGRRQIVTGLFDSLPGIPG